MIGTNAKLRDKIVEDNFGYAMKIANYFENLVPDHADRRSLAAEGLLNAVETYNPACGTKLESYIVTCVKRNMIAEYKRVHRSKRYSENVVSLDAPSQRRQCSEYSTYTLHDITASKVRNPLDQVVFTETLNALHVAIGDLPQTQREIIVLRYLSGSNIKQKVIGDKYGRTQAWVSIQERQALSTCREKLRKFAN